MLLMHVLRICIPLAVHIAAQTVTAILFRTIPFLRVRGGNAVLLTLCSAMLALPVLLLLWRWDRKRRPCCPEKNPDPRKVPWWAWLLIIIAGMVCSALSALLSGLGPAQVFSDAPLRRLFAAGLRLKLPALCLIVPFTEELIFRGLTYERSREIMGQRAAFLLVSAAFALYHGNILQILYAFPMALIMQLLYVRTGTLAGPVLFHIGANTLAVLAEALL